MSVSLKPIGEQVIVITGASSGIGLATALTASEKGAKLVLAARSAATLEKIVKSLQHKGREAVHVVADVGKRDDVRRVAATAIATFGRIDTWVNNAGVAIYGRLDEVNDADSRRLFDVNFWGTVHGSLIAIEHLRNLGGALINVGSEVSDAVAPLQGMYSASKHAVKGFTDALRVELEGVDHAPVSITLIQPTAVDTPYPQHAKNYLAHEPKLPSPQVDPQDVADAILKAAEHGGRDVKVGTMAVLDTAIAKVAPAFADKMAAKQVDRQEYEMAPQHPDGTLYRAGESGRVRGWGQAELPEAHE